MRIHLSRFILQTNSVLNIWICNWEICNSLSLYFNGFLFLGSNTKSANTPLRSTWWLIMKNVTLRRISAKQEKKNDRKTFCLSGTCRVSLHLLKVMSPGVQDGRYVLSTGRQHRKRQGCSGHWSLMPFIFFCSMRKKKEICK